MPFVDAAIGAVVGPVFCLGREPPRLLTEYASFDAARERAVFCRSDADWFERVRFGAIGSGANLAIRRRLLERNGGFRECLGAGAPIAGDETFMLFSMVADGETVVNEPSARVFHPDYHDDRYEEIGQSRVAYWAYASLNYPGTAPRILPSVVRRLTRKRPKVLGRFNRPTSLRRAVLRTPGLLLAAWRFSRWK